MIELIDEHVAREDSFAFRSLPIVPRLLPTWKKTAGALYCLRMAVISLV